MDQLNELPKSQRDAYSVTNVRDMGLNKYWKLRQSNNTFKQELANALVYKVFFSNGAESVTPVWYYFRKYTEMTQLEKKAIHACRGRVLDIGAGTG